MLALESGTLESLPPVSWQIFLAQYALVFYAV
jgi:hypothetical protein